MKFSLKKFLKKIIICQTWITDNEVRVDSSIVASDVEPPGGRIVFLNNFNFWHEPLDADLVVRMFREEKLTGQFHLGCLAAEITQEATLLFNLKQKS